MAVMGVGFVGAEAGGFEGGFEGGVGGSHCGDCEGVGDNDGGR